VKTLQVSQNSPAESAGLKVGDAIVEFGTLKSDNFTSLKAIAAIVESSVNQVEIPQKLIRGVITTTAK
jgi:predicted metalloprotease with PDZ domain